MWIRKEEYQRLVDDLHVEKVERACLTQALTDGNKLEAHLSEMNRFLIKRVNQLEYIYSQLVAKELKIPMVTPVIGVGKPEGEAYPAPDFMDPREVERDLPIP